MDRKSFLRTSFPGGAALGYSGFAGEKSIPSPKDAHSRPAGLRITDICGATPAAIYDFPKTA
ncbi:MAG TPA: hypothetical protein PKX27_00435 [Bacteroidales bacterium]|jgi:hypothetical protein|nr:hypothetical protein [Bacteroidales bacterium]HPM86416.1 hypothetical protein [Bacteroidales bacterium]